MKGDNEPKSDPENPKSKPRVIVISEDIQKIIDGMKASENEFKHDLMKIVKKKGVFEWILICLGVV